MARGPKKIADAEDPGEAKPAAQAAQPLGVLQSTQRVIAVCHECLVEGSFPGRRAQDLLSSMAFLQNLHTQVTQSIQAHPEMQNEAPKTAEAPNG